MGLFEQSVKSIGLLQSGLWPNKLSLIEACFTKGPEQGPESRNEPVWASGGGAAGDSVFVHLGGGQGHV